MNASVSPRWFARRLKAPQAAVMTASRHPVTPPRRQQKLTVRIPGYLVDALKAKALDQRTTVRHLVLLALQKDGYTVEAGRSSARSRG